uniref:Uncharacterized protein n=1 Tax=Tetranychus urticae TaxID=32264 RepID=T1KRD1_TETUR
MSLSLSSYYMCIFLRSSSFRKFEIQIRCDSSLMVISTRKGKNKLADFFEDYEISKRVVAPEERFVDVAIQVAQVLTSCRGSGNNGKPDSGIKTEQGQPIQRLAENPLKDGEQDEEDNRLFHRLSNNLPIDLQRATSPTTMWAEVLNSNHNSNSYQHNNNIDQLNNSDVNNNVDPRFNGIADQSIVLPKRHDFESQTDPVNEVLAANAGDNDLNVLQSYSLSSPFSHIEKQLANDSDSDPLRAEKNVIDKINDTTNDIKLQECLNKLLDDIEGSFSFENKKAIEINVRREKLITWFMTNICGSKLVFRISQLSCKSLRKTSIVLTEKQRTLCN